jgi:hypothetical protein
MDRVERFLQPRGRDGRRTSRPFGVEVNHRGKEKLESPGNSGVGSCPLPFGNGRAKIARDASAVSDSGVPRSFMMWYIFFSHAKAAG